MIITNTKHALAPMHERGIGHNGVEATLANPIQRIAANHGRVESRGFIERAGTKQLLRVVSERQPLLMVTTIIATSKFEKYGVSP